MVGGADDGDRNIYVTENGKRTGEVVGKSVSPNSFLNDQGNAVKGALINPSDKSGADFLNNEVIDQGLGLFNYMYNGYGGRHYDFKARGMREGADPAEQQQHLYRGMPVSDDDVPTYASARDIGNIGAGYVAGTRLIPWAIARIPLDGLESMQRGRIASEGEPTQAAQKAGFKIGHRSYIQRVHQIQIQNAQRKLPFGPK